MLCTFPSPEVTLFSIWACVLLEHYKEFIRDLAAPFPFEGICGEAHSHEGKVDIIRLNTLKPNRVTPK